MEFQGQYSQVQFRGILSGAPSLNQLPTFKSRRLLCPIRGFCNWWELMCGIPQPDEEIDAPDPVMRGSSPAHQSAALSCFRLTNLPPCLLSPGVAAFPQYQFLSNLFLSPFFFALAENKEESATKPKTKGEKTEQRARKRPRMIKQNPAQELRGDRAPSQCDAGSLI